MASTSRPPARASRNSDSKPASSRKSGNRQSMASSSNAVTLPLVHLKVEPEHLAYFAALGVMGALELIEWPLVAVMVGGQVVATRAHRRIVRELAAGVDEAV